MNEFKVDFSEANQIGIIGESRVYRFERDGQQKVMRVYVVGIPDSFATPISLKKVEEYQHIAEKASMVADKINSPFQTDSMKFSWEVVPIEEVGQCPFTHRLAPYSVSPYIDGVTMQDDSVLLTVLNTLAKEKGIPDPYNDIRMVFLDQITEQFRRLTGERAIKLAQVNVKPLSVENGYHMRITDVCARLGMIH